MKLKQFIGRNIRGHMDFNISFRDSITFLIGINGSGKTSILRLISGLLTPSYLDLIQVEFDEFSLIVSSGANNDTIIKCRKDENKLFLSITHSLITKDIGSEFDIIPIPYQERRGYRPDIDLDELNDIEHQFKQLLFFEELSKIGSPLIVGLNRKTKTPLNQYNRHSRFRRSIHIDQQYDYIDGALSDIQEIIYDNIRRNAQKQNILSETFKQTVVKETLKLEKTIFKPVKQDWGKELKKLEVRKKSLIKAINNLKIEGLSSMYDIFFNKIEDTLNILVRSHSKKTTAENASADDINAIIDWLLNSNQLTKIDNIIQYGNKYTEDVTKLRDPIIKLEKSLSSFFKESNKSVTIDGEGDIQVWFKEDKSNSVYDLSSGEKQLIILLAHLIFVKEDNKIDIFIIDEPELSLHISWQEIFVDALMEASPNTQFILATHSPSIIAKKGRQQYCEDLTIQ